MKYLFFFLMLFATPAMATTYFIPDYTRIITPGGVTYAIPNGAVLETPELDNGLIPEFPEFPPFGSRIVLRDNTFYDVIYGSRFIFYRPVPRVEPPIIIVDPRYPHHPAPIIVDPRYPHRPEPRPEPRPQPQPRPEPRPQPRPQPQPRPRPQPRPEPPPAPHGGGHTHR